MKRLFLAACAALTLLCLLTASVGAAGVAAGQPALNADTDYGYYIWFDGDHISLRTTDRGAAPGGSLYTGRITVNWGDITGVNVVDQESDDWAVASGNTLEYHFVTYNGVDGVDFTATGAEDVTFRLYRNGHLIVTDHIFLGAGEMNPPSNPFTLFV
jgi:hypothetical protein